MGYTTALQQETVIQRARIEALLEARRSLLVSMHQVGPSCATYSVLHSPLVPYTCAI